LKIPKTHRSTRALERFIEKTDLKAGTDPKKLPNVPNPNWRAIIESSAGDNSC
jgi:hypothetical protein